jgi:hypothetical protein
MRKALLIAIFLTFAPLTLTIAVIALFRTTQEIQSNLFLQKEGTVMAASTVQEEYFAASPPQVGSVWHSIASNDARPLLIKNYLEKYKSPLLSYSDFIFQISEKYGLDYGLIVAIAQCESNVCKKIPPGSYNCWGFENGETRFDSWESAITTVAETLKERYYDKGLITPDQIMPKYAPPSVEKGGPWAKCVNQFLEELR